MRAAIDTNVVSALWSAESSSAEAAGWLGSAHSEGGLAICGLVHCELLAHRKVTGSFVEGFLAGTNVVVDFALDEAVWREAERTFAE